MLVVGYWATIQGEIEVHWRSWDLAQVVDLSLWQEVQGLGMPDCSVSRGEMKRKVWAATKLSLTVSSIRGMWQAVHWLPALPSAWWVCSLTVPCRPEGFSLVWQERQRALPLRGRFEGASVCTSWQSKQRSWRWYMLLWEKSLPCMRFL